MSQPLLIDCDPGVDDAAAILLALGLRLDLRAITSVAGNLPATAGACHALRLLEAVGQDGIPVHAGMEQPILGPRVTSRQSAFGSWGEEVLSLARGHLATAHAVDAIAELASDCAATGEPLVIAALGPLTNLALAILRYPEEMRAISGLVMMGGALAVQGLRQPWAEFNVLADPIAARIVFESGLPITLFPLDVTFQALVEPKMIARLSEASNAPARITARLLTLMDRDDPGRFGRPGAPLHDPMPITWLAHPELFESRPAGLRVITEGPTAGQTLVDWYHFFGAPPNARVVTHVQAEAWLAMVERTLSGAGTT